MAPDADFVDVDERMASRKLFDRRFLVCEAIVAEVAVSVVVVPLRPLRVAAAVADFNDNEPELRQRLTVAARIERFRHAFRLRPWVDVENNRVLLGRIE